MKATQLIAILAGHVVNYGDQNVFLDNSGNYVPVDRCWFNYGSPMKVLPRFTISSDEQVQQKSKEAKEGKSK